LGYSNVLTAFRVLVAAKFGTDQHFQQPALAKPVRRLPCDLLDPIGITYFFRRDPVFAGVARQ
jgi:hypothetical protein